LFFWKSPYLQQTIVDATQSYPFRETSLWNVCQFGHLRDFGNISFISRTDFSANNCLLSSASSDVEHTYTMDDDGKQTSSLPVNL